MVDILKILFRMNFLVRNVWKLIFLQEMFECWQNFLPTENQELSRSQFCRHWRGWGAITTTSSATSDEKVTWPFSVFGDWQEVHIRMGHGLMSYIQATSHYPTNNDPFYWSICVTRPQWVTTFMIQDRAMVPLKLMTKKKKLQVDRIWANKTKRLAQKV